MRNGMLWSDRFDSEELAQCHIDEEIARGVVGDFEVEEMTEDEILAYE